MKNQKNLQILTAVLGLALIVIGGWYFLTSQKTILQAVSDKTGYFVTDTEVVRIELLDPKDATSGEITVNYPSTLVKVKTAENAPGVTMRELNDSLVFTLSEEYFKSNKTIVSAITLENLQRSNVDLTFNTSTTTLNNAKGPVTIAEYKNLKLNIGIIPERSTTGDVSKTENV